MPRLQILHHKSYHPYLDKNKQRVRDDEARAAVLQEEEERQVIKENSSARLDALRGVTSERLDAPVASSSKHRDDRRAERAKLEFDWPELEAKKQAKRQAKDRDAKIVQEKGHINFWAGLEKEGALVPGEITNKANKRTPDQIQDDDPTTMYLNRPERETKPWYTDAELRRYEDRSADEAAALRREKKRRREERNKLAQDPMTEVQRALSSTKTSPPFRRPAAISSNPVDARLHRESSERARALAMIQEQKRKAAWGSVADDGEAPSEYGDLWDADAVREAKSRRRNVRGWVREVGARARSLSPTRRR